MLGAAALALLLAPGASRGEDAASTLKFADMTAASGIDFVHTIGDDKMTNIVESTGVGCALLDYDGDGALDIYLVNGIYLEGLSDPGTANKQQLAQSSDRLYRNRGDGTFEDVTVRAGIVPGGYGMGVTVGDYDNDGHPDIYVTQYGPNRLYRNLGNGTFEEVAKKAGVDDDHFGVGCALFDYDGDSHLDLFVGNYLYYVPDFDTPQGFPGPLAYKGQQSILYRNQGDGTFRDVTADAGLGDLLGHTMGVGIVDLNEDGLWDIFVANDAMANYLFQNEGNGTFIENALLSNVAFGANGDARGAMGAELGDVDGDGRLDLFVPDFTHTCLYMNLGDGFFEDQAHRAGIAILCGHYISWGAALADFDLDGDLDLYVGNGDAHRLEGHPDLMFLNDGRGQFAEVSRQCGVAELKKRVSRGVAAGDLDNDGDLDLVVVHLNDVPSLLRNDTPRSDRHWLMVDLVPRAGTVNKSALGTLVRCEVASDDGTTRVLQRVKTSAGSYLCVHDPRLHFGLGNSNSVAQLTVRWPDGSEQTLKNIAADQVLRVEQR